MRNTDYMQGKIASAQADMSSPLMWDATTACQGPSGGAICSHNAFQLRHTGKPGNLQQASSLPVIQQEMGLHCTIAAIIVH